jgi:exosortase A
MNMMSRVAPPAGDDLARGPRPEGWPAALALLGLGLALLAGLFREEAAAAIHTWNTSTAYNHCWLVPPIAAWLAWQRRHRLAVLAPRASPWLALLAVAPALLWFAAERLGVMEGRQLAALGLAYALVLAALGWRVVWAMAVPLAYLVFMVPFGGFAVPVLQRITAALIEFGLGLTDIPHYIDALIIEIPAGTFFVAEACAGLRFSIAALAFGALYAVVMFRSPWRRLAVMALAVVVPIIANGMRALGLVLVGHWLGSAEAAAADHVTYGWVFFSIVILLLVLAGLPFREDAGPVPMGPVPPPAARRPRHAAVLVLAAGLAVALAGAGPVGAVVLARAAGQPTQSVVPLAAPDGCAVALDGASLRCAGAEVSARLVRFPGRVTWAAVSGARFRLLGDISDEDLTFSVPLAAGGGAWQGRQSRARPELVAVAAWLGGQPVGDGLTSRTRQAWNSLVGSEDVPVLAAVVLRRDAGQPANPVRDRALLQDVLAAQGPQGIERRAAGLSSGR